MALEEEYIDVPFHGGVDEHTSETKVAPPKVLYNLNTTNRVPGAVGRRDKFDRLTSAPITGAKAIAGMPNGLLAAFTGDGGAWTVDPSTGEALLQDDRAEALASISADRAVHSDRDSLCHSMAVHGDIAMYTWFYSPVDPQTFDNSGISSYNGFGDGSAAARVEQPQPMYSMKNLRSGEILVPPTPISPDVFTLPYSAGDYIAVHAIKGNDGASDYEYFLVVFSIDENLTTTGNEVFFARSRILAAVTYDTAGAYVDDVEVDRGLLLWDTHYHNKDVHTYPRAFYFATTASNAAELNLTSNQGGAAGYIDVDPLGAIIVTDVAWPSGIDVDYQMSDLAAVYHDLDNGTVFYAWLVTNNYGYDWDTDVHDVKVVSMPDDFSSGWPASPAVVWELRNPTGPTGTYESDEEATLLPYNPCACDFSGSGATTTDYLSVGRFATTTMRGAFTRFDDSDSVMLMVHGVCPFKWKDLSPPVMDGTTGDSYGNTADWYGIKMALIANDGSVTEAPDRAFIEPNVLMATKPWFDGSSAHCILSVAAPTPAGFGASREAQPTNLFEVMSSGTVPTAALSHIHGGEAKQGAFFLVDIPASPETYLRPQATFLVDEAVSVGDLPTLWNGSVVCSHDGADVALLPVKSNRSATSDPTGTPTVLNTPDSVIPFYISTAYPANGTQVTIVRESVTPNIIVADDTVVVSAGSMAYFDGLNLRSNASIVFTPKYVWADIGTDATVPNFTGGVGATTAHTDSLGNIHRSGEGVDGKYFQDFSSQPIVPGSLDKMELRIKVPIPPLTLYKQDQRELDNLTTFAISSNLYDSDTSPLAYFGKAPISPTDSPFHMEFVARDGTGVTAMSATTELLPEVVNGARFITARRNRVFFIDENRPFIVRYSKLIGSTTTVEFNNNLQVRIPESAGGATALGVMDDKVIVFTKDKTYYFAGEGPNNLGEGAFTDPRPIASSHGCINPASVISNHMGVFFQSRRGLMLLGRDLSVSYVGSDIENTLRTHTVTTVSEDTVNNEIRWSCYPSAGLVSTRQIVLNMDSMAWSVWANLSSDDGLSNVLSPVDSTFHQGKEYILLSNGEIIAQSLTDKETTVQLHTPWLGAGRMSNQRVKEMYVSGYIDRDTPIPTNPATLGFDLVVTLDYDYDNGTNITTRYSRTTRIAYADIAFGDTGSKLPFTVRVPAELQKCFIFNMTVVVGTPSDLSLSLPPDDIVITDIGVVVATKGGGAKMSNNVPT